MHLIDSITLSNQTIVGTQFSVILSKFENIRMKHASAFHIRHAAGTMTKLKYNYLVENLLKKGKILQTALH